MYLFLNLYLMFMFHFILTLFQLMKAIFLEFSWFPSFFQVFLISTQRSYIRNDSSSNT